MTRSYFAIIDRHGLRALQTESPLTQVHVRQLCRQLHAVLYWVVLSDEMAVLLHELLDAAEFRTAGVLLMTTAERCGPVWDQGRESAQALAA